MMAQVSAELRWFILEGSDDIAAVERWFKAGSLACGGSRERSRIDVYLLDRSTGELGVKERGRKPGVEVKVMVDPTRAALKVGGRSANVQVWSKVTSMALSLPSDGLKRCTTSKLRLVRKFDTLSPTAQEIQLGGGEYGEDPREPPAPDVGCNVEWTTVEIAGVPGKSRTLSLESFAFNHPEGYSTLVPSLERTLLALADRLGDLPVLGPDWQELSYPAWLCGGGINP
jgi:hypothetical protein